MFGDRAAQLQYPVPAWRKIFRRCVPARTPTCRKRESLPTIPCAASSRPQRHQPNGRSTSAPCEYRTLPFARQQIELRRHSQRCRSLCHYLQRCSRAALRVSQPPPMRGLRRRSPIGNSDAGPGSALSAIHRSSALTDARSRTVPKYFPPAPIRLRCGLVRRAVPPESRRVPDRRIILRPQRRRVLRYVRSCLLSPFSCLNCSAADSTTFHVTMKRHCKFDATLNKKWKEPRRLRRRTS